MVRVQSAPPESISVVETRLISPRLASASNWQAARGAKLPPVEQFTTLRDQVEPS